MTEVRTLSEATGALPVLPNLPELKRLNMWVQEQDKIEPGARIWYQNNWAEAREESPMCQTAYCVAGMTIVRAGHTLTSQGIRDELFCTHGVGCTQPGCTDWEFFLDGQKVHYRTIPDLAMEILGIDGYTARDLFRGINQASNIDYVVRRIFIDAGADYDAVEPAPDLEIEIKEAEVANAAEAVRPQLLPTTITV